MLTLTIWSLQYAKSEQSNNEEWLIISFFHYYKHRVQVGIFTEMMQAYMNKSHAQSYRQAVAVACRALMDKIIKPKKAAPYVVALGKRDLLWELLPEAVYTHVLAVKKNAE